MLISASKLLIVDDDPATRQVLTVLLTGIGYEVRTAEDGFMALIEIRKNVPDVLLSDLNMPGMSGFELLCVVRHKFPVIQTIAMSAMFSGGEVPAGVAADAFYQKGTGIETLLNVVRTLPWHGRVAAEHTTVLEPVWPEEEVHIELGEADEIISYAECLRMVSMVQSQTISQMMEIACEGCCDRIHSAFAPIVGKDSLHSLQENQEFSFPSINKGQRFDD